MNELCKMFEIKQTFSSPYYHLENGLVERIFRTSQDKIYAMCHSNNQNWIETIPYVEMSMRSAKISNTDVSPYEILFGNSMNLNFTTEMGEINVDNHEPKIK